MEGTSNRIPDIPNSVKNQTNLLTSFRSFAIDIKLAHSVFALPFAACGILLMRRETILHVGVRELVLLILCMIGARSYAMGMNRFIDRNIDKANPRTKVREIPKGNLTPKESLLWSIAAGLLLVGGAFALNPLAGKLSIPLLMILAGYSLGKRVSSLVHWYLGMCLGFAPVAVQIALEGRVSLPVFLLGSAVALWTAGFDVLYSLQDMAFDRANQLRSIPARLGTGKTLWVSRFCFIGMITALIGVYVTGERGILFLCGIAAVAFILSWEHWLVRHTDDQGRCANINAAFFNWNAVVSVGFLFFAFIDWLVLR